MGNSLDWLLRFPPLLHLKNRIESILISALALGPVPRHIALVMDGNRRYARLHRLETAEGHALGFESLKGILEVCYKAGVEVVTIYAFSIENFKRSKYEVDVLMDLAKDNLLQLCQHGDIADQYDIRIKILGQRGMVSDDVQKVIARAEKMTEHNTRATLNVCFPYTSRDEMTAAVASFVVRTEQGGFTTDQIETLDETEFEKELMTAGCPDPDLMIRTSGVERLSDFLLWQAGKSTTISFVDVYWPEFGLWTFLPILLEWQVAQCRDLGIGIFSPFGKQKSKTT
ncbi:Uncharacterized protein C4D7.04c [Taphrina deformans PYCC 5710]|uniref:Alkyl transferase n=1 Tax=Taphrina deformans (strain PYCC 5710 / ATCC 11124 / CBS 356.35 / IMI 108563 / JCM 9778 / NBRC 8474) TaxID=1097556 RepID=R4X7J4_TAPDE|nr:Uncharacterized protein C4D7.04c [Taphrina deformans PYCC 5710]|eukprot:CCG81078.1 Uncharacterized protein C4D7.04c [Taphrina deformans PYCC 5710]